jgi:hypothetical protein
VSAMTKIGSALENTILLVGFVAMHD